MDNPSTNQQVKKQSKYAEELHKFIGSEVTVVDYSGNTFNGICKAISEPYLNVVLMTDEEKILIKNIAHIKRARTTPKSNS